MKFIFVLLPLLTLSVAGHATQLCYERIYSDNHMDNKERQSLESVKLTRYTDADLEMVFLQGVSAKDHARYFFAASQRISQTSVYCATFAADGDQDSGCVNIRTQKHGASILVSPVAMDYVSAGFQFQSPGIVMIRCVGSSSDGEGCETGKLRSVVLKPSNPQDATYRLDKVPCVNRP